MDPRPRWGKPMAAFLALKRLPAKSDLLRLSIRSSIAGRAAVLVRITRILAPFFAIVFAPVTAGIQSRSANYPIGRVGKSANTVHI